jgi:orotidine-5'-phosphate decarboxylase
MDPKNRLVIALDMEELKGPKPIVEATCTSIGMYKVHAWAEDRLTAAISDLRSYGAKGVMLDFKYNDTPDTVAKRARKAAVAGANWITVHTGRSPRMVEAAKKSGLYVIAITVLSSVTDEEIREDHKAEPEVVVRRRANWALQGGADALVSSPRQVATLYEWRSCMGTTAGHIKLVVPGTRSVGVSANDQKQPDTPFNAILNGADYLVIGRQATEAADPVVAINEIADEITPAIESRIAAGTWRD